MCSPESDIHNSPQRWVIWRTESKSFEEKCFPDTQTPSNYDSTLKACGSLKLQPDKSMESGRELCHLTTSRDAVNIWWLVGEGEPGFCLFFCFNVSFGKLTMLQSSNPMTMGLTQMQLNEERRRKSCNLKVGGKGVGGMRGWRKEEWRGVDVHRILYVILRELISIILKERRDQRCTNYKEKSKYYCLTKFNTEASERVH